VQTFTRRPQPAVAPPHAVPLRRSAALISVAVVGDDLNLKERVDSALRREGVAGRITHGGATHLRSDRLERRPDVVLLGIGDPRSCIAEATRVRRRLGGVHVVVVLQDGASCNVRRLLEAGVDGVVLEPDLEETIGLVVRGVCAGHVSLPRSMRHAIDPPEFSAREREIFTLVVAGLTNGEIAERRFLARSTVAGRLTSIFRRLGVQSRDEAVSLVMGADESLRERLVDRRAVGSPRAAAAER
jgi:DNA-binding NarL/FixJ family response regulator